MVFRLPEKIQKRRRVGLLSHRNAVGIDYSLFFKANGGVATPPYNQAYGLTVGKNAHPTTYSSTTRHAIVSPARKGTSFSSPKA